MTRTAISPRLAMRIFLNRSDGKQSLPVLYRLSVHDELALDDARGLGLNLIHELHRFDDAEDLPRLHPLSYSYERRRARRRALIKGADDGRLHQNQVRVGGFLALLFFFGGLRNLEGCVGPDRRRV